MPLESQANVSLYTIDRRTFQKLSPLVPSSQSPSKATARCERRPEPAVAHWKPAHSDELGNQRSHIDHR